VADDRTPEQDAPHPLVVIGSSAGGIDALTTLMRGLPSDFGAPILVVQHLDPKRESHLGDILARHAQLTVRTVANRDRLEVGTVFVIPADRHVTIRDHSIQLESGGEHNRPSPSIDRALASAAEAYGEGLVAVILTGAGSDGAAGARYVKAAGGTVVIQNPETATYPWMPLSLSPTTVDVVVELESMAELLVALVSREFIPARADDDRAVSAFLEQVRERTGLDFSQYKRPTILRRLQRRLVATGAGSLREYLSRVDENPEEMQRLANTFLIKVTQFFRDPDLYAHLRTQIMPDLIAAAGERGGEVRIWSAGCATGEEAYSLAIVASEAVVDSGADVRLRIFATDVDAMAVEFARRGVYPASAVEPVSDELRQRYFVDLGGQHEVKRDLRRLIAFAHHDLGQRAPFPRIDMVVCRNVLIYFTAELQRRALQLFAFSLRDHGYLVLGKAETTTPNSEFFVMAQPRLKIYRRQGAAALPPTVSPDRHRIAGPHDKPSARRPVPDGRLALRLGDDLDRARLRASRADEVIMRLPVGVVLIDGNYDIVSINASARNLLGVHGAAIGQDLIHLVHGVPSSDLRRTVDRAFRGEPARTVWEIPVMESTSGERVALEVLTYRHAVATDGSAELVALLVRDVTQERHEAQDVVARLDAVSATAQRLEMQVTQMASAAERLREANTELITVNAELRSQVDELVVSNEEVQAATEEVETLNEEMQATNEELETLNEELQATVEELNTTNDDLEAKSDELQGLAISLEHQREVSEAERARLFAVLSAMGDAVIVVNQHGRPELTNEAFDSTFGDGPLEMEDEAGLVLGADEAPWLQMAGGMPFTVRFAATTRDGQRRWFEAKGEPIGPDGGPGGVVVMRDVTERSIQQLQDEFVSMLSHELRTPLTGVSAYLELLERDLGAEAGTEETNRHRYASRALGQVRRFAGLVNELFDANRLRTGHMSYHWQQVPLRPIIEEAVSVTRPRAGSHTIRVVSRTRSALRINADADRLQQVFINLLANAVQHAPESDAIDVTIERVEASAVVSVRDHGPGMSAEERARIVSGLAHHQAQNESSEGLGLGLFIAGSILDAHGGSLTVESEKGEGSTFKVQLPLLARARGRST
jgi:two-component system CheB/CheR fusion protein